MTSKLSDAIENNYFQSILGSKLPPTYPFPQHSPHSRQAVIKVNPFLSLIRDDQPASYMETLCLLRTFRPLVCTSYQRDIDVAVADFDITEGFAWAIQSMYTDGYVYSTRMNDMFIPKGRIDLGRIDREAFDGPSLISRVRSFEDDGISLVYVASSSSKELLSKMDSAVKLLREGGTIFCRVDNPISLTSKKIFDLYSSWFDVTIVHRPSVMCSITTDSYFIFQGRIRTSTQRRMDEDSITYRLETYQEHCDVLERVRRFTIQSALEGKETKGVNIVTEEGLYLGY